MKDENDILYNSYGFHTNIFKVFYKALVGSNFSFDSFTAFLLHLWTIYSVFAFAISALLIFGIVYAYLKLTEFEEVEEHQLHESEQQWRELHNSHTENNRWNSVQVHLASENPNDWKLAIIEADVLLERMLDTAGFAGATIGEKLKSASVRSFATLDDAWQAHRVRNLIAHGGADFVLTHKAAKETLIQYERVFTEFGTLGGGGGHH